MTPEFYGTRPKVPALMPGIRRDTSMAEPGEAAAAGLTRLAPAALVDVVS